MSLKFIETKNDKKFTRRELLIGFVALLSIFLSFIFPQAAYGETFWLAFFLFAVFPALAAGFLLKEPLRNFGLAFGKQRTGTILALAIIIIFIIANYLIVFHSKYTGQLSIPPFILNNFAVFLAFEIFIALPLHFFWEFFFRGFVQLGLEKKLGIFSLFLAAILQTSLFFRSSWIILLLVFLSALAAGLLVRQSRSILYSTFSLWIISVSLDIMIIKIVRQAAG